MEIRTYISILPPLIAKPTTPRRAQITLLPLSSPTRSVVHRTPLTLSASSQICLHTPNAAERNLVADNDCFEHTGGEDNTGGEDHTVHNDPTWTTLHRSINRTIIKFTSHPMHSRSTHPSTFKALPSPLDIYN
jgi:hypothetical protein